MEHNQIGACRLQPVQLINQGTQSTWPLCKARCWCAKGRKYGLIGRFLSCKSCGQCRYWMKVDLTLPEIPPNHNHEHRKETSFSAGQTIT